MRLQLVDITTPTTSPFIHLGLGGVVVCAVVWLGWAGALHAQDSCRDLLGAEQMYARCLELRKAGQCEQALDACREAALLCEGLPRFSQHTQGDECTRASPKTLIGHPQGESCAATSECLPGLLCQNRRCAPYPNAAERIEAWRASAQTLAALSPCDARGLLELACGVAQHAGLTQVDRSMRQELHAARAACRGYRGVQCEEPNIPLAKDGAEMVLVPAGMFVRGSDKTGLERGLWVCRETYTAPQECDLSWFHREGPRKDVFVGAFAIDKHEVTNALYTRCRQAGACQSIDHGSCSLFQRSTGRWKVGGQPHPDVLKPNHPVVCVTWQEAQSYCAWAGKRLPTEAEWEKAARGSEDAREFPWGNGWSGLNLNWGERSGFGTVDRHETTSPVGYYPLNVSPYGAMDMSGNAWEWTSDYHSDTYYAASPLRDPVNTQVSTHRVLRGGSWSFAGNGARVAYRYFAEPDNRDDAVGFRCVQDIP